MPETTSVNWVETLQALGLIFGAAIIFIARALGGNKSDGTPPANRPPDTHEVRQALQDLQSRISRSSAMDEETARAFLRRLEGLTEALNRNSDVLEKNTAAANAVANSAAPISRSMEELSKEMEFSSRMGRRRE